MLKVQVPRLKHLEAPKSYFQGVRSHNLCQADNVVMFIRRKREVLRLNSFEARPHHRYVLITMFETAGSINVDGSIYRLQPGDTFLIAPYQFHFYMDIEVDSICWLYLTFEAQNREPFESFINTPINLAASELKQTADLAARYDALDGASHHKRNLFILSVQTLLNRIKLLEEAQAPIKSVLAYNSGYTIVEKVNHVLSERLGDGIGILAIANLLSISESHLRKRFKSLTGLSLGSYLVHYKLNQAVKLLVRSESSLTEIATRCGYDSLAAFSRSFKSNLGSSPSEYRKNAVSD